jgi:gluconolactonase
VVRLDPALDAVIAPGTRVGRVAGGFGFVEGPVWKSGRLYFSDVTDNNIRALDRMGNVVVVLKASGGLTNPPKGSNSGSNGLITDKDGTILVTRMGIGTIEKLDEKGALTPVLAKYEGKRLNSPNDLVFARDGALWFTDPSFGLPKMDADPKKEIKFNGVYRYAGGKLTAMITDMKQPNGIGFSPDGKTLYVSNSMPDMVLRAYDVGADGKLSNKRILYRWAQALGAGVPDGLKVDSVGNIWATGPGGVSIISPQGKVLGRIVLPEVVANLAFAEDGKTVYLTATSSVYRLGAKVPGEIPLYYRK